MGRWSEWRRRFGFLGRRSRFEQELAAEIQFHLDARADELTADGWPRRDAELQARREFGPDARVREASRETWHFQWLEDLAADLRYALRALRRSPAFTLTVVLSLGLGIGANSAIFAALDAVLWKPLSVAAPDTLVRFAVTRTNRPDAQGIPAAYVELLRRSDVFSDLVTVSDDGLSFADGDRAERVVGEVVSSNFFTALGLKPILGQGFTSDVRSGHWAAEAVISYRFWARRFGADRNVVGRTIHLNTYPFTIVGVCPPSFLDLIQGMDPEVRIPLLPIGRELPQIAQASGSPSRSFSTMARLKSGITLAQAQIAADAQFQAFLRSAPREQIDRTDYQHLRVLPGRTGWSGDLEPFEAPLFVLQGLVILVLLIACANVADMLLVRGASRERELALRASIGASRHRLIRQLLAESLVLAMLGGTLGVGIAAWSVNVLPRFLPRGHIDIVMDLHPDARMLVFTLALSVLTGLLFGIVPALQITRGDLAGKLKATSGGSIGGAGGGRTHRALVVGQVAFGLVLLVVAGLFVRTVTNLHPSDLRGKPDHVLLFTMKPQRELYDPRRIRRLVADLIPRIEALPGVQSASLAENGPLGSRRDSVSVEAPGRDAVQADLDLVTPRFFETIGVPHVLGRDLTEDDKQDTPLVAVVNEALARALFGSPDAVGRTVRMPKYWSGAREYVVVGVVRDMHYYDVHAAPPPAMFLAIQQDTPYMPTLHVRTTTADTAAVVAAIRHEFDMLDPGFPVFNIKTLALRIDDSVARERLVAAIAGAFGALALLLAGVGLYGLLAFTVSRRTREIGVRVALGSSTRSVVWLVAVDALVLVLFGAVAGAACAAAVGFLLARFLFGVSPFDPATFGASLAAMLTIALVAAGLPAYRASRIDPLLALHAD